jgi:hypothetical protein
MPMAACDSSQESRNFKVDGTMYDPRDGKDGKIHDWPALGALMPMSYILCISMLPDRGSFKGEVC